MMENLIVNFSNTNLPIRGFGFLALQRDDNDRFELVSEEVYQAVNNGQNRTYSLNYGALSFSDKTTVIENGRIVSNGEAGRTRVSIDSVFTSLESLVRTMLEATHLVEYK